MGATNPHAVALGRKGGRANTEAQRAARLRNIAKGRRPVLYRIERAGDVWKFTAGRWRRLEPPYDLAAKAFLRRHRIRSTL